MFRVSRVLHNGCKPRTDDLCDIDEQGAPSTYTGFEKSLLCTGLYKSATVGHVFGRDGPSFCMSTYYKPNNQLFENGHSRFDNEFIALPAQTYNQVMGAANQPEAASRVGGARNLWACPYAHVFHPMKAELSCFG